MATNSSSSVSVFQQTVPEQLQAERQGNRMLSKRRFLKWFGLASTLALSAGAFTPDMLGIPLIWRPWVFLASIFWICAFISGMFNL